MSGSTAAQRRLKTELKKIRDDPPAGISVDLKESNIMTWSAIIFGPYNTAYENGEFTLSLIFTEEFPLAPPLVTFTNASEIFHPNVYANGRICLDILQSNWKSTYSVANVLTAIQALLSDPNPDSPANREAADLYKNDRPQYEARVRNLILKNNNNS